jgi:hypothetical protein
MTLRRKMAMPKNYLKAVLWDYPELCNPHAIIEAIRKAREKSDTKTIHWLMARFLERARIRDTALFFKLGEIQQRLNELKISPRAEKRWKRLLEVYGDRG